MVWLRNVGGHLYAVIALSFVAAANFGTAIAGIYASAIGLRNFRRLEKLPWLVVLLLTITPVHSSACSFRSSYSINSAPSSR